MRDLVRALRTAGDPVPVPWASLGRLVKPRRGNLAVALAAPGVGKSTWALEWVDSIAMPSLYISLDTALVDQAVRVLARRTGNPTGVINTEDESWARALEELQLPVRFFDRTILARNVSEVISAEAEYWGESPAVVVIDNAGNLLEKEESAAEYRRIFHDLHIAAREQNTFVLALHHIGRLDKQDRPQLMEKPVTLTDGLYAGEHDVNYAFGLWRPAHDQLRVGVLKNRMGEADAGGALYTTLTFDGALARVQELSAVQQWASSMGAAL